MRAFLRVLLHLFHGLLWCGAVLAALLFILLCLAAYGIPGRWIQSMFPAVLSENGLLLSVDRVAYLPLKGLQVKGFLLRNAEKERLASFSSATFAFSLFSAKPWEERLTGITVEDLFVTQVTYDPDYVPECTLPAPEDRRAPIDLSHLSLPRIGPVELTVSRSDTLEIRLEEVTGTLEIKDNTLFFSDLHARIDSHGQTCDADLEINLPEGVVEARIRGFLFQTRLNGIWRALNFPVIEKYCNNFVLETPAWGDCTFTVGIDKYRNIFRLALDVVATDGAYCGVPFDEATATISCHGIWDTVTEISPIVVRRNGDVAAKGSLTFDIVNDCFRFRAESTGLRADECLKLIDMPFTEAIPVIRGETPPHLTIQGEIPLYTEQTPARVLLSAEIALPDGGTLHGIPVKEARSTLSMEAGTLSLTDFTATLPNNGTLRGHADLKIPEDAAHTDLSTLLYLEKADLGALLTPFGAATPENATVTGFVDLSCRTDDTFAGSLRSAYSLTVDGGLITRLPLFAGLTNLIADNIPGISALTDSSTARLVGSAEKGYFILPEFSLTGDLLSIEGPVSYDLKTDHLLARIIAGNFKQGSLLGYLTRWATVPLNRLMWQAKVTGPLAEPDWEIVTIVEGLWSRAWGKDPFAPAPESETEPEASSK